ncbi:hypothetical protein CEP53_012406 [Fusarium sp. AF-6]|nr:hypothetical protein CEP53_012406 [Fusarium sp. AF-6]
MKMLITLLFAAVATAAVAVEPRQEPLVECCYELVQGPNKQLFRTSKLSEHVLGVPGHWCIAAIDRDAAKPNECAAGTATVFAGYCDPLNVQAPNVPCPAN